MLVILGEETLLLIVIKQPIYSSAGIQRIILKYMGEPLSNQNATLLSDKHQIH